MPCPECAERGCEACNDAGYFRLTDCPYAEHIDAETNELIQFADWFKKGIPPVVGGSLDQSAKFMQWCDVWWRWTERLKSEALGSASDG